MDTSTQSNSTHKPAVFRFEAQLLQQPETGVTILVIPEVISKKLKGLTRVEGTINNQPFRTALESGADGGARLRVSKAMSHGAGATAGDTVKLAILGPEPVAIPADLKMPLAASPAAMALWEDLTPLGQLDWIRWINLAKNPETRARRITRTIDQLAEGKRRACCVNVNEYMLCRIEEDELKALGQGG